MTVAAILLNRVFSANAPYARAPRKAKIMHSLALLFLASCFINVPQWIWWLIAWPRETLSLHHATVGIFQPVLSLVIFFSHIAMGVFTLLCVWKLAWGIERWRRSLLQTFPIIGLEMTFYILKVAESRGATKSVTAVVFLFVGLPLVMIYMFYSGRYGDILFGSGKLK